MSLNSICALCCKVFLLAILWLHWMYGQRKRYNTDLCVIWGLAEFFWKLPKFRAQQFSSGDLKIPLDSMLCGSFRKQCSLSTDCVLNQQNTVFFPYLLQEEARAGKECVCIKEDTNRWSFSRKIKEVCRLVRKRTVPCCIQQCCSFYRHIPSLFFKKKQ